MAIAEVPSVANNPLDIVELRHKRRESVLTHLVTAAARQGAVRDADVLLAALLRRERVGTTALGKGVAVTHARSLGVGRPFTVVGRSERGVEWDAPDGQPVHVAVMVLSTADSSPDRHIARIADAAHAARLQRSRQKLREGDAASVAALLLGGAT